MWWHLNANSDVFVKLKIYPLRKKVLVFRRVWDIIKTFLTHQMTYTNIYQFILVNTNDHDLTKSLFFSSLMRIKEPSFPFCICIFIYPHFYSYFRIRPKIIPINNQYTHIHIILFAYATIGKKAWLTHKIDRLCSRSSLK